MTVHDVIVGFASPLLSNLLHNNGFHDIRTVTPTIVAFDGQAGVWHVTDTDGTTYRGRVVITSHLPDTASALTPYLGVASHGVPNYFAIVDDGKREARIRYVVACLRAMAAERATRIEVRRSTQQVFHDRYATRSGDRYWAKMTKLIPTAFDIWSPAEEPDELYEGPATVSAPDVDITVRARLTGHLEPIDGRFHWQGILSGELPDTMVKARNVAVTIADRTSPGRLGELTPWGYSVTGVGAPPFPLGDAS